jgi:hypothetical protein
MLWVSTKKDWAGWARQRATGLRNILEARQNTGNDPQVALRASESFLLLLDQPDSSLALLSRVSADTAAPQAYRVKALYGSAYLWGTAKADSVRSDSLYRQVVQLYPGTEFAKQAQRNLGLEVDQMTQEDRSARYLSLADSAYSEGQYALASAWTDTTLKYQPDAEAGARALWLKAHYRAALKDTVGIKTALTTLLEKHPGSIYHPWAQAMLDGRVLPDGQALENERQSLAMLQRRFEELVQMRERDEKTKADRESQQGGEKAEEELLWDYNQMYDF